MGDCPFTEHPALNPRFHPFPQAKLPLKSTGARCDLEAESRKDLGVQPWLLQGFLGSVAVGNTDILLLHNIHQIL